MEKLKFLLCWLFGHIPAARWELIGERHCGYVACRRCGLRREEI